VVVPGNHDVPLYNLLDRLARPLAKFRRYIEPSLAPCHVDDEVAVLGINTARSLVVKNGRVDEQQIVLLRESLCVMPDELVKVVVTHHPFDVGERASPGDVVGRAGLAMRVFAQCGVDVLLAGHLHVSHSGDSGERHALGGYGALVVSAGTATSTRGRGEANSFNVLRLEKSRIDVQRHEWVESGSRFRCAAWRRFVRTGRGWKQAPSPASHPIP
jgi:3',5'-cyclic AMP phosphodiesterase CpdA